MSLIKEITNLRTVIITIVVIVFAMLFLFAGAKIPANYPTWKSLFTTVGSVIFASVAIPVIWELFQKRSFREELLESIKLSENIQNSGVDRIYFRFDEIDWKGFFNECKEFDLFITYARSWRGTNEIRLREIASRAGAKVRVVLPDYNEPDLVAHFAVRYRKKKSEIESLIKGAIIDFSDFFDKDTCQFDIRLTKHPPTNGYYRFGNQQIITLYNYRDEKGNIPVFIVKKPGRLYDFFDFEFEYLFNNGVEPPNM